MQEERIPAVSNASAIDTRGLSRLAQIAEQLGENSIAAEARQFITRISEGRFFVACIGQFKRGKSTLLNALVEQPILPAGVVPVTTVPTVLRYGESRQARVLIDGTWHAVLPDNLANYVSEELNPENRKRVEGVEVFLPSKLLASGMCLVDTPGVGSVFAGNTETTRDFIPQIDAAILVVGADPPISGEELALMEAVAANVDEILVALNKIDRVSTAEREQASAFAGKVLSLRLKKPVERIYEISALNKLSRSGEAGDLPELLEDLIQLASRSGESLTRSAVERGGRRFSTFLMRSVDERIRALTEPIVDSQRRVSHLRETVSHAEQSLRELGVLFSAEQMRLSNTLLARRKNFLRTTSPIAIEELDKESCGVETAFGPARRRELMALAQTIARGHIMPWLDAEEIEAEKLYTAVTGRFVGLVNQLLQLVSQEHSGEFSHLSKSLEYEQGFLCRSRFFFHDMTTIAQPASPLLYVVDALMGVFRMRRWFQRDAEGFLEQLLDTNAARVQGDVEQRVVESRLCLESDVRRLLREVSAAAEYALENAQEIMAAGTNAATTELDRLSKLHAELAVGLPTSNLS